MKSFPKSKTRGFHSIMNSNVSEKLTVIYVQWTNLPKNVSANSVTREHVLLQYGCFKRTWDFQRIGEKFHEMETFFYHLLKNSK